MDTWSSLTQRRVLHLVVILALLLAGVPVAARPGPAHAAPLFVTDPLASIFINEIHYDNTGTDAGEAIEIAGPAGTNLSGWSIVLYNGAGGAVYDTDILSGVIPDQQNGFGTFVLSYPVNGVQNGAPDGIALVDPSNTVVLFLSYEGSFTAVGGPANGLVSTNIGVSESGTEPLGQSLRLSGTGNVYGDFVWNAPATATFGSVNTGQTFTAVANQPVIAACGGPHSTDEGTALVASVSATDADGTVIDITITSVTPSPAPGTVILSNLVAAATVGGTATADVTVDASVPAGAYAILITATNDDSTPQTGTCTLTVTVLPPPVRIREIQGAAHLSPKNGQTVSGVVGIVTALRTNGFYMQDPDPDGDNATSEGIFVFTSSAPTVSVGDAVTVNGTATEFRPGGSSSTNLTTSEITSPIITLTSTGNPLPAPIVIGNGGRVPPGAVIENDATGDVETSGVFDSASDGIDFYESLEGMRVQVNDPVVVGPRNDFGEIWVLGDDGANAAVRTTRGGIVISPTDFNPERIQLDDAILFTPSVDVGDHFTGPVVGVVDYSFGNFEVLITTPLTAASGGLAQETTANALPGQLAVATFNVENLDPNDGADKFDDLANLIVNHLRSPDLIALEEVQDNNGPTNDSVVDASLTYAALIDAIQAAGGPTYAFRNINPVDDQDGGEPGGNIRVGFLFRTDRGLAFVDRPGGASTAATTVLPGPQLSFSPGRIDPTNSAFLTSRKPLAGEFTYYGQTLFVIANHFNSKGGDQPLFGHFQPPTRSSEVQRNQQAQVVNDFVDALLAEDSNSNIIVLGDLNDFEFSTALATVRGGVLHNLIETLPPAERYTYDFEGNSQMLDHLLVSDNLFNTVAFDYDIVHVNAEFAEQASDHDPQTGRFCLDQTGPTLNVTLSPNSLWPPNHKYVTVNATVTVTDNADPGATFTLVSVTSNEPDEGTGDDDLPNDIVIVNDLKFKLRAERSETGTGRIYTITYQATDACGNTILASATVTVPHDQGE